jgi:antirestriction protein ArdC
MAWRGKQSREDVAAARDERIQAAQAVLSDAVGGIRDGVDWQRYLEFQSQLHEYSANNCMLLISQQAKLFEQGKVSAPFPTYVASYRKWQELGRQVQRGQTGMAIIAPMRGFHRDAVDKDGTSRPLARGETPKPDEREVKTGFLRGFTVEKVFSAEQTDGDSLPAPPPPQLLEGEAPSGLGESVLRLIESRGYTVSTVPSADDLQGANGRVTWATKTVQVRADMDDAAMVKSLLHEGAHCVLHDPATNPGGAALPRGHKEVEAESVAFIVARAHGMPTDAYSFAYVAAWAGEDHDKVLAKTAQRVAACAKTIIAESPAEHITGGKIAPARAITPTAPAADVELAHVAGL